MARRGPPETAWLITTGPNRPALVGTTSVAKSRIAAVPFFAEQGIPHNLLNGPKAGENVEREAEIIARRVRPAGPVTNRHQHGLDAATDIISVATANYTGPLKLREVLLPRLVRPGGGPHVPPFTAAGGCPAVASGRQPLRPGRMPPARPAPIGALLPAPLHLDATQNNPWWSWQGNWSGPGGDRASRALELGRPQIAQAAEKAPPKPTNAQIPEPAPAESRRSAGRIRWRGPEEEERVRQAGGLHVIGTERQMNRERVDKPS